MDDLSRKFRSVDWKSFQRSARRVQQSTASALKDLVMTDLENKTRSSTADTPWGASTTDLQTIAQGTYNRDDYALIMSIIWQRLASSRWRCVYKALDVLKYLLMHGSARCLEEARGALGHLETLRAFRKVEGGRDVGEGVRSRAEGVVEMLRDDVVLCRERDRSEELRKKMVGGGEGVYGGRYDVGGGSGAYDDDVVKVGTSGFKGYDDVGKKGFEEEEGEKRGDVDDLLGGGGGDICTEEAQQDDDEDFNPRGEDTYNDGTMDMLNALKQEEKESRDDIDNNMESTSARIARLAAEKGHVTAMNTIAATSNTPATAPIKTTVWDDDGPPTHTQPKVTVTKKDDPFSDLLTKAKKAL